MLAVLRDAQQTTSFPTVHYSINPILCCKECFNAWISIYAAWISIYVVVLLFYYLSVTTPCWACRRQYHYIQCGGNSICILHKLNIPIHCKKKTVALTTSVASQCLLYCGNQRMCTKAQPTVILLATVEKLYSMYKCHFNVLLP